MSQPFQPQFSSHNPLGTPPPSAPASSGKATTALIMGLGSMLCTLAGPIALLFGLSALKEINASQGRMGGKGAAITGIVLGGIATFMLVAVIPLTLLALLIPAVGAAREAARQSMSTGHLKQIGLGMHNYHDVYKAIPMAGSADPALGANMSWRVRLLPFIEQMPMHDKIDYTKPWDAAPNDQFHTQMPQSVYGQPGNEKEQRQTQYLVFTHDGPIGAAAPNSRFAYARTWFHPTENRGFRDTMDGSMNTIMVIESDPDRAVPWMKPADLALDPKNPKAGIGNYRPGGFLVVMGDGSTRFISNQIDNDTALALILPNDGVSVDVDALNPRNSGRP